MAIRLIFQRELNLTGLIESRSQSFDPTEEYGEAYSNVELLFDLSQVQFITPAGIAGVFAMIKRATCAGACWALIPPDHKDAYRYSQRMGLYEGVDINLEKEFLSHPSAQRFKELTLIASGCAARSKYVDALCKEVMGLISPSADDSNTNNLLLFCIGEIVNNVIQHSGSPGDVAGAVCAQFYPSRSEVEVAIVDHGRGILKGLMDNPDYQSLENDVQALELAVQPDTSGTFNQPYAPYQIDGNSGNGLYFLRKIIEKTYGFLEIWSYKGHYFQDGSELPVLKEVCEFNGTLVVFRVKRDFIYPLEEILQEIREESSKRHHQEENVLINFTG